MQMILMRLFYYVLNDVYGNKCPLYACIVATVVYQLSVYAKNPKKSVNVKSDELLVVKSWAGYY